MKYQITHLKAPWPEGSAVGDVIDMEELPPWALGKCSPAPTGAKATVSFKKADPATPNADGGETARRAADAKTGTLAAEASALGINVDGLNDEQIEQEIAKAKKKAEDAQKAADAAAHKGAKK